MYLNYFKDLPLLLEIDHDLLFLLPMNIWFTETSDKGNGFLYTRGIFLFPKQKCFIENCFVKVSCELSFSKQNYFHSLDLLKNKLNLQEELFFCQ